MGDSNLGRRPTLPHSHSCPVIPPELRITVNDEDQDTELVRAPSSPHSPYGSNIHPLSIMSNNSSKRATYEKDTDAVKDKEYADTLVEAALDHAEVKARHVQFQEHVVKSAALVDRMMGIQRNDEDTSNKSKHTSHRFGSDSAGDLLEMEETSLESPKPVTETSGSVLASLMKLEAQRRQSLSKQQQRRQEKEKKKTKPGKSGSWHDLPSHLDGPPTRPKLTNRPYSWLSSNHLVPSLEKRQKMSPSASRRSSIDSMITTASQFEPITLEDRIHITFEIANILQKQAFLRKLIKCLMLYGCPAHRLEYIMRQVSSTLSVEAEYVNMPNIMLMSVFDQSTHTTETHFIRQAQAFDMHKLGEIYRLEKLVSHGEVSVDEALEFLDEVANEPPFYPVWLNPFVYGLASFCGCIMFFGGMWRDGGISAALAMMFAVYEVFSGKIQNFQPIWEVTVCIIIGFVAQAVTKYGFCFTPIAFSSFIVILPGYPMAVAVIELVSRQLVSGVVRMVYSIVYSFLLGYGIQMGAELYRTIDPSTATLTEQCRRASEAESFQPMVDLRFFFLLVPLFALAYCIFVRARPVRWPVMIIVSAAGYVVNFALSRWANAPDQVLQVVPAFTIGFLGNILTKITGKMSFDAVLLGVFYLVPGGLGIKAGYGMFDRSDNGGSTQAAGFALAMIESSIGITLGLFVATLLVYPRGSRTPLMNF